MVIQQYLRGPIEASLCAYLFYNCNKKHEHLGFLNGCKTLSSKKQLNESKFSMQESWTNFFGHNFCFTQYGRVLKGTVWLQLPTCYHQNLGIFWIVWIFFANKETLPRSNHILKIQWFFFVVVFTNMAP